MEKISGAIYKTYNIIDFLSLTKYSQSFAVSENGLAVGKVYGKSQLVNGSFILRRYEIDGRKFFYFSNGYLMEESNGTYKKSLLTTFSSPPEMFTARYKGKKTIFVYFEGYLYSLGLYLDVLKVPEGKSHEEYKGGLYFISGNSVIFCEDFFKGERVKTFDFLMPEEDEGNPLKISRLGTSLFVFFERGIYKIESPFDSEKARLIKVGKPENISAVFTSENQAYFLSDGMLKTFDGKEVKSICKIPNCEVIDDVQIQNFTCAFIVKKDSKNYLLAYEKEGVLPYLIEAKNLKELSVKDFEFGNYACWESLQTNLGVKGKKFIRAININTNDKCDLIVNFDGRERKYHVDKRHITLGITAEKVSVKICTCDKPITITNLQFLYRKGE